VFLEWIKGELGHWQHSLECSSNLNEVFKAQGAVAVLKKILALPEELKKKESKHEVDKG
jgi:hypothetical protein